MADKIADLRHENGQLKRLRTNAVKRQRDLETENAELRGQLIEHRNLVAGLRRLKLAAERIS
jgi:small-conductance mechanosensitive channel